MATWMAEQILLPQSNIEFDSNGWSANLLNKVSAGFVRQLDIFGTPGIKLYVGELLSNTEEIDKYFSLGPSGVFSLNLDNGFLISDIRIDLESYQLLVEGNGYLALNIVSSYAPSSSNSKIVIYNGGGVTLNGK